MEKGIAISVRGVSKTFKIPHERISSLRGAATSLFSRKKGFEQFKALDNVSFEVKKGEFFGIIGRNGSGKSTLLKILAGIYQPDKGEVRIHGRISPFLELGIGFNPELSGRDNIYLNATVLGLTRKQINQKFDSIVAFSELERFIDQKLKNYSSGMQVRLAFSVSIHANRDILLMDEVLAVGDSNFSRKCIGEFERYKKMEKTIVLVTHDIKTIEEYCDRAVVFNEGAVTFLGRAAKAVERYMSMNIRGEKDRVDRVEVAEGKKRERFGNGFAIIEELQTFDSKGEKTLVLESGKEFSARMLVKFHRTLENLAFAVMFKDMSGKNVFGLHSSYCRKPLKIKKINKGCIVECTARSEMVLPPGTYNVYVACASIESHLKYEILDSCEDFLTIEVFSDRIHWSPVDISTDFTFRIQ